VGLALGKELATLEDTRRRGGERDQVTYSDAGVVRGTGQLRHL